MRYAYRFVNLCGTVYKGGDVSFSSDGNTVMSPVGNRVACIDLVKHASTTLDAETRSDITRLVLSPDGRLLLAVDADGYALAINYARRVVVHRFNFKAPVAALAFSPDGKFLAVSHGRKLQIWRTPTLDHTFSAFELLRTLTGHFDDVTCIDWSPTGRYVATGSKDMTVRIYSREPVPGFVPVTLSGHRDHIVAVFFADADVVYSAARDGAFFVWSWEPLEEELSMEDTVAVVELAEQIAREAEDGGDEDEVDDDDADEPEGRGEEGAARSARRQVKGRVEPRAATGAGNGSAALAGTKHARPGASSRSPALQDILAPLATRRPHAVPAPHALPVSVDPLSVARGEWGLKKKHFFRHEGGRVQSVALHRATGLIVVGFSNGVFGLWTMPGGDHVHTLSISQHDIGSVAINSTGDWLAFASATLGQLLVWEWKTETYVLKQQGHFYDLRCVAHSPNGQLMATGSDDAKVKVWNASTGFCFVTFAEHTAPVTAVAFVGGRAGRGLAVLSASLDGSVRAFDLVRYRNFRTLTPPEPAQLTCLACDDAGEVVCAGSLEPFSVYVWALQTGRLTDVLTGHEAPVSGLAFSSAAGLLASSSWDKTVRLWDIFKTGTATETLRHGGDVLAVAFRPDGQQLAAATVSGQLAFWDVRTGTQTGSVDARGDIHAGRKVADVRTAATAEASAHFSSIAYTADGECVLAAGRSRFVCLYAVTPKLLLRRWQVTHNRSLDGVLDKLSNRGMGEGGPLALLDLDKGDAFARKKLDESLPGVKRGVLSVERSVRPEVRCTGVQFSPTGLAFAVASTEGLLVYGIDDSLVFDPFELGEDVTPAAAASALESGHYARAFLLALHLGDAALVRRVIDATPLGAVRLVASAIPSTFLARLLEIIAASLLPGHAEGGAGLAVAPTPHLEFALMWCLALLDANGSTLRSHPGLFASGLRGVQRALLHHRDTLGRLCATNRYLLEFLSTGALAAVPAQEPATLLPSDGT